MIRFATPVITQLLTSTDPLCRPSDLVHVDLDEIRGLHRRITGTWEQRHDAASRVIDLVRGDFLGDLRYEPWAATLQLPTEMEVRRALLPIAQAGPTTYESELAARAASALLRLDPFDEAAVIALAPALHDSGRAVAAKDLIARYFSRIQTELDDQPSEQFVRRADAITARPLNFLLTSQNTGALEA